MKGKYVVLLGVALLLVTLAAGCRGAVTPTPRPTSRPLVTQVALITATPAASSVAPTASALTPVPAPPTAAKPGPQPSPQPTEKRPPIIQLVAPMAGTRVSQGQRVVVQALAGDDSGVGRVELWIDSELVGVSQGGPGLTTLQATQEWVAGKPGDHVLTVLALDIFGNRSQPASVTIAVAADLAPPKVQLLQPLQRIVIQVGQQTIIQAVAYDEVGIVKLELWADDQLFTYNMSSKTGGESPFVVSQIWYSNGVGDHKLFVRAYDSAGQRADSTPVVIGVADTNPPQVAAVLDRQSALIGQQILVLTNAADSKGITRIELWADNQKYGEVRSGNPAGEPFFHAEQPYTTNVGGRHILKVIAYDSTGKTGTSGDIPVTFAAPNTPSPVPQPTALPPTQTPPPPPPTAVPTKPAPPSVQLQVPSEGFVHHLPTPLTFKIAAGGPSPLVKVELWGWAQGQRDAWQLLQIFDGNGERNKQWDWLWGPPGVGPVAFRVVVFDQYGYRIESPIVNGYLDETYMPTVTPEPQPQPRPNINGTWRAGVGAGYFQMTLQEPLGCLKLPCPYDGDWEDGRTGDPLPGQISEATFDGTTLRLTAVAELPGGPRYTFEGKLNSDGRSFTGTWSDSTGQRGQVTFQKQ